MTAGVAGACALLYHGGAATRQGLPMRNAADLLTAYARDRRDRRNIVSHFVSVPLTVFALGVLLSRPELARSAGLALTPAWLAFGFAALWYLTRGSALLGFATSLAVGAVVWLAHRTHDASTPAWLAWAAGVFAMGWLIQSAGHWYEGRRPAFAFDPVASLTGPLFVTAEALFALGWGKALLAEIERRVGPSHLRDLARIA